MSLTGLVVSVLWAGVVVLGAGTVWGQNYPNKPIRILAGSVGGNADTMARLIAQGISGPLGQPVIVENQPAILISEIGAKAPPDGYVLFINGGSAWIRPFLQSTAYDPVRDFAPITMLSMSPDILVVHPSLPVKSVNELIALAKARPGVLNYASGPPGNSAQLVGELLKSMARISMVLVPYPGTGQQITAVISGETQLTFATGTLVTPHFKSGRLKALAVASLQPSVRYRGLPTMAASLPGFESVGLVALFAPGKTPTTIINRLNQEIVRVLNQADVRERMFNDGVDVGGNSPQEAQAMIKADMARWGKVIQDAGIHMD